MADPGSSSRGVRQHARPVEELNDEDAKFLQSALDWEQEDSQVQAYRTASLTTVNRQDRHLKEYQDFVKRHKIIVTKEFDNNVSDDELDNHCFPNSNNGSFEGLYKLLRAFLNYTAGQMTPRSSTAANPSFASLKSYTDSISARLTQLYKSRSREKGTMDIPDKQELREELNKCCSYLVRKYDFATAPSDEKTHLGRAEIAYLIDVDLQLTKCIAFAECHHLAWTLGLLCGLRPCSLGPLRAEDQDPKVKFPYLTFRDCQIHREGDGRFDLKLRIRNLKTNTDRDAARMMDNQTLTYNIDAPKAVKHLSLSPALRILAIALRRNALKAYSSVEELLSGKEWTIYFKDDFLDKPVLLASSSRGLAVTDKPMSASCLTSYLDRRGPLGGFPDHISFYCMRRFASSNWARSWGNDTARALLGHTPDSKLAEKHYLNTVAAADVSALGFDQSERETIEDNVLLWERLSPAQLEEIYSKRIPEQIEQMKQAYTGYPHDEVGTRRKKTIDNDIRNKATREVMRQFKTIQSEQLKLSEVKARRQEILNNETVFNEKLLSLADEQADLIRGLALSSPPTVVNDGPSPTQDTVSLGDRLEHVPYETAVAIVLKMMVDNSTSQRVLYDAGQCQLCLADPTVSDEDKARLWTKGKLKRHIEGQSRKSNAPAWFHSPKRQFERRCASTTLADGRYLCPYCVQIAPSNARQISFISQGELNDHIKLSDSARISGNHSNVRVPGRQTWGNPVLARQHDALKTADGWYNPSGFMYGVERDNALRAQYYDLAETNDSDDADDENEAFEMGLADTDDMSSISDSRSTFTILSDLQTSSPTAGLDVMTVPDDDTMASLRMASGLPGSTVHDGFGDPNTMVDEHNEDEDLVLSVVKHTPSSAFQSPSREAMNSADDSTEDSNEDVTYKRSGCAQDYKRLPGTRMSRVLSLVQRPKSSSRQSSRSEDSAEADSIPTPMARPERSTLLNSDVEPVSGPAIEPTSLIDLTTDTAGELETTKKRKAKSKADSKPKKLPRFYNNFDPATNTTLDRFFRRG